MRTHPFNRWNVQFSTTDWLRERGRTKCCCTCHSLLGVTHAQPHVTNRRAMLRKCFGGKTLGFSVQNDIDRPLPPKLH